MTNDDLDLNDHEDLDNTPTSKPSLREIWDNNPVLKRAAIILGIVSSVGAYAMFANNGDPTKSIIRLEEKEAIQAPATENLDPEYIEQLKKSNKDKAEAALASGDSQVPTPIDVSKDLSLNLPAIVEQIPDALDEWRKKSLTEKKPGQEAACPPRSCFENAGPVASCDVPRAVYDEAKRAALTSGATVEAELAKIADPTMIEEAKRCMTQDAVSDLIPMQQPIRPQQPPVRRDPKTAEALSRQMLTIIQGQAPPEAKVTVITSKESPYAVQLKQEQAVTALATAKAAGTLADGKAVIQEQEEVIAAGGDIAYVQLLNELNSDVKGPVIVQVLSGPFAGGRALGKFTVQNAFSEYLTLTFQYIVKDGIHYDINGIAMDEKTTLTGQATDVDHHYFTRIILPAAAKFIEGYGSALAETGTESTSVQGVGVTTSKRKPSPSESAYKGLEEASSNVAETLDLAKARPITIKIAKGTTMGLLFLDHVTTKDAGIK